MINWYYIKGSQQRVTYKAPNSLGITSSHIDINDKNPFVFILTVNHHTRDN